MNKAQIIIELSEIKSSINKARFETTDEIERLQHNVANFVDNIIIDLIDEDRENETCCACEDCPAIKKMNRLDSQAEMIKKLMGASMTADEIIEAEKMARGKRARGSADR